MKKDILNYNLLDELEELYYRTFFEDNEECKKYINDLLKDIENILNNYETISDEEYIRILQRFIYVRTDEDKYSKIIYGSWSPIGGYECHSELNYDYIVNDKNVIIDNDMIDLYNKVNNTDYKYLTSLKTKMIYNRFYTSGWGKDRDEYTTSDKVDIIILTNELFNREKAYTKSEVQSLIDNKKIFVIASNKMQISEKDVPKDSEEFYDFGISKESPEYKRAYASFLKSKISKEELYKIIKLCIVYVRKNFYKNNEEFKETSMYGNIEEIYTKKFKYKRKWN